MAIFNGRDYIFEVIRPFLKLLKSDARQIDLEKQGDSSAVKFTDFDGEEKIIDVYDQVHKFNKWTSQKTLTLPGDTDKFYPVAISSPDKYAGKIYTVRRYIHEDFHNAGTLKLELEALTDCDCCGWKIGYEVKHYQADKENFVSDVEVYAGNKIYSANRKTHLYTREGLSTSTDFTNQAGWSCLVIYLRGGYTYHFGSDYVIDQITFIDGAEPIDISGCEKDTINGYLTKVINPRFNRFNLKPYTKDGDAVRSAKFNGYQCLNVNPAFKLDDAGYPDYVPIKPSPFIASKAMYIKKNNPSTVFGTEYFPVNSVNKRFRAVIEAAGNPIEDDAEEVRFYFGVRCFDAMYRWIEHHHEWFRKDPNNDDKPKYVTLYQDLNVGDTEIIVEGDASWFYTGSCGHCKSLAFHKLQDNGKYCYVDEDGNYYNELGYTRDVLYNNIYDTVTDNGDGTWTIHLQDAYNGEWYHGIWQGTIPAGTRMRDTRSGGTYNYWISWGRIKLNGKINYKKTAWYSWDYKKPSMNKLFRDGTHYAKLMILPNYAWRDKDGNYHYSSNVPDGLEVYYNRLELQWKQLTNY